MKKNKFSIIIPVYNVEPYLKKCLDSVVNQTYQNYEAIIICDKCDDNSEEILDEYIKKNRKFKKIYAENTGLSIARNLGVDASNGEYILFLDGDDFYEINLLKKLNENLIDKPDLIRFQVQDIKNNEIIKHEEEAFETTNGITAFNHIFKYHYIENAWSYCYNSKFYKSNNFKFQDHRIAEDFGLLPLIIAKAQKVKSTSFIGYNYTQRENSLMSDSNYNKKIKKMYDMIKQAEYLKKELEKIPGTNLFLTFVGNSLIYFSTKLKYKDYKKYRKILKKEGFYNYLMDNNLKQKIKNQMIKINAYAFYHYMVR